MAPKRKIYQTISKRARQLLDGDEYHYVDFKRSPKGISSEDLVSFANSEHGGTVLLGVDEQKDKLGRQTGKVVGCEVSDAMKLLITSRALSCFPPVKVEIFVENNSDKPFYRVEVPSGTNKPYCTSGGTYKIREDGRNKVLRPDELLNLFIHSESEQFFDRLYKVKEVTNSEEFAEDRALVKKDLKLLHEKVNAILRKMDIDDD